MHIDAIDTLAGQRVAFEAPAAERAAVYRERVLEPLRPFWEPMLAYMPRVAQSGGDPVLMAAGFLGLYGPEQDAAAGLEAIARLEQAGARGACQRALDEAAAKLQPVAHGIALDRVTFSLALMNPIHPGAERNSHYTGFGGRPGQVMVTVWPTDYNVPRLPSVAAHEFHHNVRLSFEPWTDKMSVGQYIVLEGLAEAFVAEQYGDDLVGPWATVLTEAELAATRPRIRAALDVTGFNEIRGYIFGDWAAAATGYTPQGLPDFAGYAVGYALVRAYLQRTGQTVAAATYRPWREIVDESRYL